MPSSCSNLLIVGTLTPLASERSFAVLRKKASAARICPVVILFGITGQCQQSLSLPLRGEFFPDSDRSKGRSFLSFELIT